MRYPAAVFDLFGTLIDNFTHSSLAQSLYSMAEALGAPAEAFRRAWLDTYEPRNRGAYASTEENVRDVCRLIGLSPTRDGLARATALRLAYTRSYLVPRGDTVATLAALKDSGRKLALVSDCSIEVPGLWPETQFAPWFDATVFSCLMKAKKPEPVMYLTACERLSVAPEDCLYCGDGSSRELSGAAAVGMHPVLIRAPHEDHPDSFRPHEEPFAGPTIQTLAELLSLL